MLDASQSLDKARLNIKIEGQRQRRCEHEMYEMFFSFFKRDPSNDIFEYYSHARVPRETLAISSSSVETSYFSVFFPFYFLNYIEISYISVYFMLLSFFNLSSN